MSIKYYVTALLFILFDVEAVFLFLWAKVFKQLGWFGVVEVFIFLLVLFCGYIYALRAGALEWD